MPKQTPTIKGIFVKSHIRALREMKGKQAVEELQRRYGKSLRFTNFQNIPVEDEVHLIDCMLDILQGDMPGPKHAFEAGRLHFRNFLRTPVAKIIYAQSRISVKTTFMMAGAIASRIFHGLKFTSVDIGKRTVKITIQKCEYPLEHFQGFFQEWLSSLGHIGSVTAQELAPKSYEYMLDWHEGE